MQRKILETFLGAIVIVVALSFALMIFNMRSNHSGVHYELKVYFDSAEGLTTGTEVRLGGVYIGYVDKITLDHNTLQAIAHIKVNESISLPVNTSAEIANSGLLGNTFLQLIPNNMDLKSAVLADGDVICDTSSPISLEDLFSQAIFALTQ